MGAVGPGAQIDRGRAGDPASDPSAFEAAEVADDATARRAWLTFVVVGAGPTGVELAGQIAEIAHDTLHGDFRRRIRAKRG